jgi:ribonuclease G
MQRKIIINSRDSETRVALLENSTLAELYIEQKNKRGISGNIYKGKVTKVLPGMQAAFVDIGINKDVFLYVSDFFDHLEEYEPVICDEEEPEEPTPIIKNDGSKGKRKEKEKEKEKEKPTRPTTNAIEDLLKEGQEVLVQVAKEPIGTKGARATSHITLPGRYLVLMPTVEHIGVSHRITDPAERQRLKDLIKKIKTPNMGLIVRTVGEGKGEEEFVSDLKFLTKLWDNILKKNETTSAPSILRQDLDLTLKTIRDIFTANIDRLVTDSVEEYERCLEFMDTLSPKLTSRVKLYLKERPIFDYFNIEAQIDKALKKKVWLKSGGYIVIDEAEALVAIDVNTGKYVGKKNLEDTILKINLEAVKEIVRQVRLRDLGGIIVIDFIDMAKEENRKALMNRLNEELKNDRTRTQVLQLTELGLVQMTRKRIKQSLGKILTKPCPYCKANGRIKSDRAILNSLHREISLVVKKLDAEDILIRIHPTIASLLLSNKKRELNRLQKAYGKRFTVQSDDSLHQEEFNIAAF